MSSQNAEPRGDSRVMMVGCHVDGPYYKYNTLPDEEPETYNLGYLVTGFDSFRFRGSDRRRYRRDVKRIEFHDSLRFAGPDAWDASLQRDHSVLAWMDRGALHFAAEGGVIAPRVCLELFARYENCEEIRFNGCFDTSQVTHMGDMFEGCASLTTLDLSGFDTSHVKYMGGMFQGCSSLSALDLSGFDTSSVVRMNEMFRGCDALPPENIRGYDRLPPGARASLPSLDAAERERLRRESEAAKRERTESASGSKAAPRTAPQSAPRINPQEAEEDRKRVAKNLIMIVLIPLIVALAIWLSHRS